MKLWPPFENYRQSHPTLFWLWVACAGVAIYLLQWWIVSSISGVPF